MSLRDKRKSQTRQQLLDAALTLSTHGKSFGSISLREVTREAGVVPTAFYRHFQDMDELGAELVNLAALCLHHLLKQIAEGYQQQDGFSRARLNVIWFFNAVDADPLNWTFLIKERWGGSSIVRANIARELVFFQDSLARLMAELPEYNKIEVADLKIMTEILINLSFAWGMSWLKLPDINDHQALSVQQEQLIARASRQVQLLFKGVSNWLSVSES